MTIRWLVAVLIPLFAIAPLWADESATSDQSLLNRIEQLEMETQFLRSELVRTRNWIERLPPVDVVPASLQEAPAPDRPETEEDWFTFDELQSMMREATWTKGDLRIVPYGALWGSALYATTRNFPGPYTLYIPSVDSEGEDTFTVDTRRTRLGLNVTGPRVPLFNCAPTFGKVEIDFHGSFAMENKPGVLLRHAYAEVKDDYFRLLAGQTWDIISPLYPGTLSYSVGWGGGNIGYRRAQVRFERYLHFADALTLTLQGSFNQNVVSDFNGARNVVLGQVQPESSGWPVLEGRLAVTHDQFGPSCQSATVGISGHIGNQGFDFVDPWAPGFPDTTPIRGDDIRVRTWSFNVDVRVPITDRFGVQGEFFTGQNLGTFLGGVVQGVNRQTARGIRSRGGWFNVWYDINPCLHTHAGYGIDDPINVDVAPAGRTYNQFLFANVVFDVIKNMQVGLEVSSWKTHHFGARPGDSVQFEFMGEYSF